MRVVLDSGRRVAVYRTATSGAWVPADAGGEHVVVLCHSAPGAGLFDPDPAETRARNVRLLGVDRPGYGGSSPVVPGSWATVASAADDLAAVLETVCVERAGVVGWAAGGRVALALAARRPDLVERLAIVATPAPDDEVPWMEQEERDALRRVRDLDPDEAHAQLADRLADAVPEDPHTREALSVLGAAQADETALRAPGVGRRLGDMLALAFSQGAGGLAADIAGSSLHPWGFEPGEVRVKTLLLYGSRDPLADPRHGRWWEARLPDARLEIVPGAGHLLVVTQWARVLSHLGANRAPLHLVGRPAGKRHAGHVEGPEPYAAA